MKVNARYLSDDEVIDAGQGDGATVAFVLSQTPKSANNIRVFVNGLRTTDYTVNVGTKTVTFNSAPEVVQTLTFEYDKV